MAQETWKKIQDMVNNIPAGIGILYAYEDGRIELGYMNDGFYDVIRENRGQREEFQGANLENAICPEDLEVFKKEIATVLKTNGTVDAELRVKMSDGGYRWFSVRGKIAEKQGDRYQFYGVLSDINEEKEANLKMSRLVMESAQYQAIVDESSTAVLVLERESKKILFANKCFRAFYDIDELLDINDKVLFDFVPREESVCCFDAPDELPQDDFADFYLTTSKNTALSVRGRAISWNGIESDIYYMNDETELWDGRQQLQHLIDQVPSGIGIYTIENDKISMKYMNDAYYQMMGFKRGERLTYISDKVIDAVVIEDRKIIREQAAKMKNGSDFMETVIRIRDAYGDTRWIRIAANAVERKGGIITVYCSLTDFTEQSIKLDMNEMILAREEEQNRILKEALLSAKQASEAKGSFMSRMSHEIRTPLNAVIGYLEIAKDEDSDREKVAHCLEQSETAARHLLSIINDVLDISSIESGRMKIADEAFDITQLAHSLTTIFFAQAKEKDIQFDVNIDGLTEEWIRGDSLRVNQVLLNLLSNAVKFTPEKGRISLGIHQVSVHEGKVHLRFDVKDTGIGMSEEYMSRMFTPFEQESASTARTYGGSGLGLSICQNLVHMMGGTIEVSSKQGVGTTFSVMLAFDIVDKPSEKQVGTNDFTDLYALVVDDQESDCEYIGKLLARCGVKYDTVMSGKKAVRRVKSRIDSGNPYDFCIIDWMMDGMDGLATAKGIREVCENKLPIIVATAYDYSSIADLAKEAGVDKIVSKPLFQSTMFNLLVETYGKYTPKAPKLRQKVDFEGLKVILAEDNEMNMEIALDILKRAGLDVTPAANGQEAYDIFAGSEPGTYHAILMDVQMPVMDGYEATRKIRRSEHPEAHSIPIVAMTANAFTEDVTAALSAGMNDHVSKPISYERLFGVLSRLVRTDFKK